MNISEYRGTLPESWYSASVVSGPPPEKCACTTASGVLPSSAVANFTLSIVNCVPVIAFVPSGIAIQLLVRLRGEVRRGGAAHRLHRRDLPGVRRLPPIVRILLERREPGVTSA